MLIFVKEKKGTGAYMEEENSSETHNEGRGSYTGEYGNSVKEGDSQNGSTYSYSYRNGASDATRSGDYDAKRDDMQKSGARRENVEYENLSEMHIANNVGPDRNYDQGYKQGYGQNGQYGSGGRGPGNADGGGKKPMGMGKRLLITAVCAVFFGIIAGVCFEGVRYVSNSALGLDAQEKNSGKQVGSASGSDSSAGGTGNGDTGSASSGTAAKRTSGDVSAIVEQTMPAIVAITSTSEGANYYDLFGKYYEGNDETSSGSGFIVGQNDKELLIATNNHVIENAKTISIQFIDDEVYQAAVKGTDVSNDLAVVAVNLKSIKSSTLDKIKIADLGNSDELKVGEMAIAIGNSLGYGQSVTVGYISAKDREIEETSEETGVTTKIKAIQTDAAINPGNSGGALLNMNGQVIGINAAKIASSSVEGVGYAIPISVATPIIDDLMNKEILSDSEKGYLGISGKTVTDAVAAYNIPTGVYVAEVAEDGAADKAGIKSGDIITGINNMEVTTIESLQEKANSYRKGTTVKITLQRSDNGAYVEKKLDVTLQGESSLDGLSDESSGSQNPNDGGAGNGGYGFDDGFGFLNPFSN